VRYRRKDLEEVELGEELILLEATGQRLHRLNSTASAVWRLCDGKRDVSMIAASLAQEFNGASGKEVQTEVQAALLDMVRMGILDSCG
jgi:hypothetical protein